MIAAALSNTLGFFPAQATRQSEFELINEQKKYLSPQAFLSGNIVPGWKMVQPLPISVEYDDDDSIIVSDNIFFIYGCGETRREALEDYSLSLIEYYDILSSYNDSESQSLHQLLQQYLRTT